MDVKTRLLCILFFILPFFSYGQLDDFSTNYNGGFSYLVNPDLQLDASAGWQGSESLTDWFVDAGFSWRTNWR